MTLTTAGGRRLTSTLYAYAFLTDLVLLYPVYALLFADSGLSVGQISSLFAIWSVASIVLEIPAGVWADATSRRLVLCLAPLCTAAGFTLWTFLPSYPAFALGFVLWGAGAALASGALEALAYDELDQLGLAHRYARTMGRVRTAETVGVLVSILLAGPVLGLGGYPAVGLASVAACLLATAVAIRLPEHRQAGGLSTRRAAIVTETAAPEPSTAPVPDRAPTIDEPTWWQGLRDGVAEARRSRPVRAGVLLVAVVTATWSGLEEYIPLLARDTGVALTTVPLLLLIVAVGQVVGGLLASVGERLRTRGYAVLLAGSALALASGAVWPHPAGFVLLAAAFCGFQLASVLADARLQDRITGTQRATVTSLAAMVTELITVAVYAGFGIVATASGNGVAFAVAALPYLLIALLIGVRNRPDSGRPATESPTRIVA